MSFFFLVTFSLFLYTFCFLWPNLWSLSWYHFDTQSLMYDLLNSATEIPNIRIASISFKFFATNNFLFPFSQFSCGWKTIPDFVFENGAHKQISTIKDTTFQFGLFLPRIKIFPHKSINTLTPEATCKE